MRFEVKVGKPFDADVQVSFTDEGSKASWRMPVLIGCLAFVAGAIVVSLVLKGDLGPVSELLKQLATLASSVSQGCK